MTQYLTKAIQQDLKKLGLYQLIGGGAGVLLILWSSIHTDFSNIIIVFLFLSMITFFAYSIFCGVLCLQHQERCLKYSLINQFLQLIGIAAYGFAFQYAAGIYLHIGMDLTEKPELNFGLGISKMIININSEQDLFKINFNIVAIVLIVWIEKMIRRIKTEITYRNLDEIGKT